MKTQARLVFLFLAIPLSFSLLAEEKFSVSTLMSLLAKKESSSAKFVEYRHSSLLTHPIQIKGKLFYKKPDILIKENMHPKSEKLTIISDRVELEKKENGKKISRSIAIEDYPFIESMVVGLRATFSGDLKRLEKFYTIKISGSKKNWQLDLVSKSVDTDPDKLFDNSIKKMIMNGSGSEFKKIEMIDAEHEKTVINISPL